MPQLELHFQGQSRRPIHVEDSVIPTKGMTYTLELDDGGGTVERSFVVTLVRRRLWPKTRYMPDAKPNEFLAGGALEVMLAPAEDVASGKVRIT
jgi:hypothetical protein